MSAITKAIFDIKQTIPIEVLNLAFLPRDNNFNVAPLSLDEYIKDKVIMKRVMQDANIVGGRTALVPLNTVAPIYSDPFTCVYRVPKSLTQGCDIVSALSVNYYPYSIVGSGLGTSYFPAGLFNNTSLVTAGAQRIADSYSDVPPISVACVDLIGPNTVVVRDFYRTTYAFFLRCILANEENLNNINPRSWIKFSKLCILAVKSYIYNTMVIELDRAYLMGGQELGAVKEIIERYSDAEEQYIEYLETKWQKVAFINDQFAYNRFLKLQVNPAL